VQGDRPVADRLSELDHHLRLGRTVGVPPVAWGAIPPPDLGERVHADQSWVLPHVQVGEGDQPWLLRSGAARAV